MNPLTIAIRANGGDRIGLGHIRRCLSLAQAMSRQGAEVRFITNADQGTVEMIRRHGFDLAAIDPAADFEETRAAVHRFGAAALLVDSYDIDSNYLADMRAQVGLLVVIDDVADRRLPVDMVINGNIYGPDLAYDVPAETILLGGNAYAILRQEFAEETDRQIAGKARQILLTVGGSDAQGLTLRLMEWILGADDDLVLSVVVGPFFNDRDKISEIAAAKPGRVRALYNPSDMRELMLETDLAVTGGGQTTYELAATGTPAVAVTISDHQLWNLQALAAGGSLVYVGSAGDPELKAKLLPELDRLRNDPQARRLMSERGRALIDGRGADRLAAAIISECAQRAAVEVVGAARNN